MSDLKHLTDDLADGASAKITMGRTLYNKDETVISVELANLLGQGAMVAMQDNPVIFELSPMAVEVEPPQTRVAHESSTT